MQRERQDVTLAAIAEQTKIRASLLEGLERDDVSQWPGGIFRRAYVRAYARAIGLDPEAVAREFLERYPDPLEIDIPSASAPASESKRPPTRLENLIGSAVGVLPALRGTLKRAPAADGASAEPGFANPDHPDPPAGPVENEVRVMPAGPLRLDAYLSAVARVDSESDAGAQLHAAATGAQEAPSFAAPAEEVPPVAEQLPDGAADLEHRLGSIAELCTRLARAQDREDLSAALEEAAVVLQAAGLTVWMWDPRAGALRAVLAHGYSTEAVARLPRVRRDADNAVAEGFRSAATRVVRGSADATGALVAPLLAPHGCAGVLALELRGGAETRTEVRALATILAAQLSMIIECPPLLQAVSA